jgi:hypothetical protein
LSGGRLNAPWLEAGVGASSIRTALLACTSGVRCSTLPRLVQLPLQPTAHLILLVCFNSIDPADLAMGLVVSR